MFREMKADIIKDINKFDGVCVTTNGVVKYNGALVMGAGVAKLFRDHFRGIDLIAGQLVQSQGNRCFNVYKYNGTNIITFPTKNHWRSSSCILRIKTSCIELMNIIETNGLKNVALPRPGCSNGGLEWTYVAEEIKQYLDSRVIIVSK